MPIPRFACPVVYTCVRSYLAYVTRLRDLRDPAQVDWSMFGQSDEDWGDILQTSEVGRPTPETVRLRAFFALELVYNELIPRQLFASSVNLVSEEMRNLRIARTEQGMEKLGELALLYKKRLGARAVIAKLKRDNTVQLGYTLARPADTFDKLHESCSAMAGCLRRGDLKKVSVVGENLSWSFSNALVPELEVEQIVRTMLTVDATNPIHAWERV